MKPLVIIATPNICWLKTDVPYPKTPSEIAAETKLCRDNGASVLHIHGEGQWALVMSEVRKRTDILIQCGMSSIPLKDRMDIMHQKADMISIILNHHDEAFAEVDCNMLHTKAELEDYAAACRSYGVKPEFEVWHSGSIWNHRRLIGKGLLDPPDGRGIPLPPEADARRLRHRGQHHGREADGHPGGRDHAGRQRPGRYRGLPLR
jgi:3-keto-5-aminohexanoate cleavage enzyme